MKKITKTIVSAFLNKESRHLNNTRTDGTALFLYGNKIAEHKEDGLYITTAGWKTNTTKDRLNALPNVDIFQKDYQWFLNGERWNGELTKVS